MIRTHLALSALCLFMASPALASGNADEGEALVHQECEQCHLRDVTPRAPESPPAFRDVVRGHKFDRDDFRSFLRRAHYPMPPKALSTSQIEDLIAYFDRLGYWP